MKTYTLLAAPILFTHGQFKGKLKGVTFSAISSEDTKQWLTINCGQFQRSFSKLIPASLAEQMVDALTRGDNVEFPGLYQEEQFVDGFVHIQNETPIVLKPCEEANWLEYQDSTDLPSLDFVPAG